MAITADAPVACRWCGCLHGPRCPCVKKLEFYPDGAVKSVEFCDMAPVPQPVSAWPTPNNPGLPIDYLTRGMGVGGGKIL